MGVVIKQSFWGTFIAYFGVAIGYINTLYLRPEFFSLDEIGLFTLVTANAMIISPLTTVGMNSTFIKFYPALKDSKKLINQFFTFQLSLIVISNILILLIAYLNRDWIIGIFSKGTSDYSNYLTITAIIVIVNSLFDQLYAYSSSILKVIFPAFLREVFLRIGAIVLVVGYAGGYFGFEWAVKGLAINYSLVLILLFAHLIISHKLRFDFNFSLINKNWRRKIFNFSLYSMSMAVAFAVINNASYNQVSSFLGDAFNGIFVTCFFIGVIVEMPRRNMARVVSPLLSGSVNNGDIKYTEVLYKKSSITMAAIGALLFIGIMTNLEDLFSFIPKGPEFAKGFGVVLAVCAAKLVLMVSSFAGEIINYSKHYRYNLLFQVLAAIFLVGLNYLLLPIFGLNGVAISYFLTIFLHSIAKNVFVQKYFHIHPFMKSHFKLLIITAITLGVFYVFDTTLAPFYNIILRSILTTIVFTFLVYKLKISEDINRILDLLIERITSLNR
ncbi:MAG: polysaccharide biosynthesis C-terminal domain-containing protein [Cyclobacteriaceae bacterium]